MFCKKCGYKLEERDLFCPKCGSKREETDVLFVESTEKNKLKPNLFAIIGFSLSLASILFGFIVAIPGIVVSIIGFRKVEEYEGQGKTFSIIGIIVGGCMVAYGLLCLISIGSLINSFINFLLSTT